MITTLHASRKVGLTSVPVSYRFNAAEMQYVIDNSDATVVLVDAEQASLVAAVRDQLPKVRGVLVFGGDAPPGCAQWDELVAAQPDSPPVDAEGAGGAAGATMIYTSGTTGKPKGAMRTGTDAGAVGALLAELDLLAPDPVHVTTGPLYHSGPLSFALFAHAVGGTIVVLRKFDPTVVATPREGAPRHRHVHRTHPAEAHRRPATGRAGACRPVVDAHAHRQRRAGAVRAEAGGDREARRRVPVRGVRLHRARRGHGAARPRTSCASPARAAQTYGPIEVRIVRDDGTEAEVGEPGELFIRTTLEMDGYHHTDERLSEHDGGDWKSVGDVAYLDDEGYLYICDRKKDMIISGGVNIYPAEIEAVIHEHPAILDVAVFGIPDDEWGERVHAIVQPRADADLDLDELRAFVDARIGGYKRPRDYEVRDELPRTESGKLLKRVLRDEYWRDRETAV